MKIYLASRWTRQKELHQYRTIIEAMGHTINSGWLDEGGDPPQIAAKRDLRDIDDADLLILEHELKLPIESLYGGMFVEFGYALAKGKKLWVVETTIPRCIFTYLDNVVRFDDWKSCLNALEFRL